MWFPRRRGTSRLVGRRAVVPALVVSLLLALSGCSLPGGGPDPQDAADTLASGLSSGDLDQVGFTDNAGQARTAYAQITDGVGKAKVTVGKVTTDGDQGKATLTWSRDVGSKTWSYETEATLHTGADAQGDKTWLVDWDPRIIESSLKAGERLSESTITARRGEILGAGDAPIVTPRPVLRVGIDKTGLAPAVTARSAARLAQLVEIDAQPYVKQVSAAGPKAFVQAIVYRRSSVPGGVLDGIDAIPGARTIADKQPLAPDKDFAAAILGSVGPATAELVKESKGRIRAGDDVGVSGLQKRYDEQLAGTRGATIVAVDDQGTRRTLFTADPKPGTPLSTTIDIPTQQAAQQALAGVGPASALVAIRPSTGDIVAVASGPGSKGYNTATFGQYAPGSTFKVVSALALLRAGVSPTTKVACTPTVVVDGKTFKNYDDYPSTALGRISFADALANSCNTAFISQRDRLAAGLAGAGRGRAGPRGRPRHRVPGVLRQGRARGERDPEGGGDDRPGHRARLADGDGHRRRLGAQGVRRAAAPAPGPEGRAAGPGEAPDGRGGPPAALDDAWCGRAWKWPPAGRRPRRTGDRQDRHGRVR